MAGRASTLIRPRSFLKWAGGKGQLVLRLLNLAPDGFGAYHEPFIGGGALFFALHREGMLEGKRVVLSDINQELVLTYRAVKSRVSKVIELLRSHEKRHCKDYFYDVRDQAPSSVVAKAARMIYLNKTGFNGLYRVNSKGQFNVPFGRYKNPSICDEPNLRAVSKALRKVEIKEASFEKVLDEAASGDFVYFDPPYVPVSTTANFVGYAKKGFGYEDQKRLAEVFSELRERGVLAMLSNSDTPPVQKLYSRFRRDKVLARRQVNSNKDRRGPVGELVVLGYEPPEDR